MAICSKSEKCISDIQKKLQQWEIDEVSAQKIIDCLIAEKFIDEQRYAEFYVRDKFRFNGWGKAKIIFMLKGKFIPSIAIKKAIAQISDDDYFNACCKLVEQKSKSVKAENNYEYKMKLIKFAQSRGFEYDVVLKAVDQL